MGPFYPGGKLSFGELLELAMAAKELDINLLSDETGVPSKQIRRLLLNLDPGIPKSIMRLLDALGLCITERPLEIEDEDPDDLIL